VRVAAIHSVKGRDAGHLLGDRLGVSASLQYAVIVGGKLPLLVASAVVALGACRNSPTTPSVPDRLRFPTGGYILSILYDPPAETCSADASSFALASRVRLTLEGGQWTGRSVAPADGSVELTFRDFGGEPQDAVYVNVAGTVRGIANDINNPISGPLRRTVRFGNRDGDTIELRGRVVVGSHIVIGELSGPSRVEGLSGSGTVICSSARWTLTPS
jgi:hypothetical protein